jgi:glycosyltransferase involved in cell wall biosynthesis
MSDPIELSVVMPCLNEAETLETCIRKAQDYLRLSGVRGEVVIADNGSTDGSQAIAERLGARVAPVTAKGYGNALMGGIQAAQGKYIIMGDADDSYDFTALQPFVEKLREGYDLVMGNRFKGGIKPGAMPPLHRYLGNPVLTAIGRLFFGSAAGDFHCGLRGFSKDAALRMDLRTTGMEFASEMVVKASLKKMKIAEVPTTLSPDGRSRPPHLRSWRDGWRHLRFLLLYSPRWLFLIPGISLMAAGTLIFAWLLPEPRFVGETMIDVHTLLYAAMMIWMGFQAISFGVFSKIFGYLMGLLPGDPQIEGFFKHMSLEAGLIAGFALIALGLGGSVFAVAGWAEQSFGSLDYQQSLRLVIPSVLALTVGAQVVFTSFFLSLLRTGRR